MKNNPSNRKLAAIMFADIVSYSRLMGTNEEEALKLVTDFDNISIPIVEKYHGEVIKKNGDQIFCEFSSAKNAVDASIEIQNELATYNDSRPKDFKLEIRIGIHIGDVVKKENDVFGDGVNVASRLESIAPTGGVCVSKNVYDELLNQEEFDAQKCDNMCDNCKDPKEKTEGMKYVKLLLEGVLACRERFKPKEMARIMVGDSNSLINQHMSQIEDVFGSGKEKSAGFWHSIIRQVYVKQLLTKEIESYGVLKITEAGKEYLKQPYSFEITEDHNYDSLKTNSDGEQKGEALDTVLFNILKDLRKKIAKSGWIKYHEFL